MYRKILVPVDGSEASDLGLQEAIKLARSAGGKICLVHVANEIIMPVAIEPAVYPADLGGTARDAGKAILAKAKEALRTGGVEGEASLLESAGLGAADLIVEHARRWGADLIVMGTHGRRGARRLVMGSDAENVVRLTPVPVLLVRAPAEA